MKDIKKYKNFKVVEVEHKDKKYECVWDEKSYIAVLPLYLDENGKIDEFGCVIETFPCREPNREDVSVITFENENKSDIIDFVFSKLRDDMGITFSDDVEKPKLNFIGMINNSKTSNESYYCLCLDTTNANHDQEKLSIKKYNKISFKSVDKFPDSLLNAISLKALWHIIKT